MKKMCHSRKTVFVGASLALAAVFCLVGGSAHAIPVVWCGDMTNPETGMSLSATAELDVLGGNLVVTLSNVGGEVMAPSDVLTAVVFELPKNEAGVATVSLTPISAMVPLSSTVVYGSMGGLDGPRSVGGEWCYSITPPPTGIGSAGLGTFGSPKDDAYFDVKNLQGPANVDGIQYGITSLIDNVVYGNAAVTGDNALIQNSVVFTLAITGNLDPRDIYDLHFWYGTGAEGPDIPGVPEPVSMVMLGCLGAGMLVTRKLRGKPAA